MGGGGCVGIQRTNSVPVSEVCRFLEYLIFVPDSLVSGSNFRLRRADEVNPLSSELHRELKKGDVSKPPSPVTRRTGKLFRVEVSR